MHKRNELVTRNLTGEIMQVTNNHLNENPLDGLISEEVFGILDDNNLLSVKGVRDYKIRQSFLALRLNDVTAYDAIEIIRGEYPYLQFDTIRKIVYRLNGPRR